MRKSILMGALVLTSCGGSQGAQPSQPAPPPPPAPSPGPSPTPPPGPQIPTWQEVAAVIEAKCGKCHNGAQEPSLAPQATFLASPAKAKLLSGAMPPPPAVLSQADETTLVSFLSQ